MTLFVVFGIGADDIFVFDSAWRHARRVCKREAFSSDVAYDVARMQHALPHAASTMFATSLTTAAAFFANAVSLVPPIRLFGIFAGLMIVVLYLMVILWLPAVFALHSQFYHTGGCCAKSRGGDEGSKPLDRAVAAASADAASEEVSLTWLTGFLRYKWVPFLWRASPFLLPGLSLFFGACFVAMLHIQPSSSNPALLPPTHNHFIASRLTSQLGAVAPMPLPVDVYWGLTPRDSRGLDPSVDDWDDTSYWEGDAFDWRTPEAQAHMMAVCDQLLSSVTHVRNFPSLECPLYSWRDFLTSQGHSFPAPAHVVDQLVGQWYSSLGWPLSGHVLVRDGKLKWLCVRSYSTMNSGMGPLAVMAGFRWWEEFINDRNAEAPSGEDIQPHSASFSLISLIQPCNLAASHAFAPPLPTSSPLPPLPPLPRCGECVSILWQVH